MADNHMHAPDLGEHPPSYSHSRSSSNNGHSNHNTIQLPPLSSQNLPRPSLDATSRPTSSMQLEPPARPVEPDANAYSQPQPTVWPSTNPFVAYYQHPQLTAQPASQHASPRGVDSPSSYSGDGGAGRGGSVLSFDDPDVRLAAEALGDLRADFVSTPRASTPSYGGSSSRNSYPEPLLSLITETRPVPLVRSAVRGSIRAYQSGKDYSPAFKTTAEFVERRVQPIAQATGIDRRVRWFLGGRRRRDRAAPTGNPTADQSHKRRRPTDETDMTEMDPPYQRPRTDNLAYRSRRNSQASSTVDSLPPYDEGNKAPPYDMQLTRQEDGESSNRNSHLIMSTSGLSIAMSDESLRSLKYCLSWLRWANGHIGTVLETLKAVLDQVDGSSNSVVGQLTDAERQTLEYAIVSQRDRERQEAQRRVAELKRDVLKTLKDVVDVVSKYAGGALPENARVLVKRHLTSLPQRFKIAQCSVPPADEQGSASISPADRETKEGARKVMVLAKEGLDMMSQVSGVLDGTIVSAEEWCERLGRRNRHDEEIRGVNDMLKNVQVRTPGEQRENPMDALGMGRQMEDFKRSGFESYDVTMGQV